MRTIDRYLSETVQEDVMEDWFQKRTNNHIDLVAKYLRKLEAKFPKVLGGITDRIPQHDKSKFQDPERGPYVIVTWQYKCKDDGVPFEVEDETKERMNLATQHHVKNNAHHPEYHSPQEVDLINREDRDKPPEQMVDATKMPPRDIAEMIADWCAMSEEKCNTPREWADQNVNVRWKFTPKQKKLLYVLIDSVWE